MSHHSERLETRLASGILRTEQTFSVAPQAVLLLLLEVEELEGMQLSPTAIICRGREKLKNRKGRKVLEEDSKISFLGNPIFSHLGVPWLN